MVYEWLIIQTHPPQPSDVIFVLAGEQTRKGYGLQLLAQRYAPRLILSTARYELRRFSQIPGAPVLDLVALAAPIEPRRRHFFVVIEQSLASAEWVGRGRFGTLSEIQILQEWLRKHPETKSVMLISDALHLRRVRYCCRAFLPRTVAIRLVAAPAPQNANPLRKLAYAELIKFVFYLLAVPGSRLLAWAGCKLFGCSRRPR